jgi:hypothetical protein
MNVSNEQLAELSRHVLNVMESARPAPLQRRVTDSARELFEAWEATAQLACLQTETTLTQWLDSSEATVAAQLDYLRCHRHASNRPLARRARSDVWRAFRDTSRWSRKLLEGAEIELRRSRMSELFAQYAVRVDEMARSTPTFTIEFDPTVFDAEDGDGWMLRVRKQLQRRSILVRDSAPRPIPMGMLAQHYLVPAAMDAAWDAHQRMGSVILQFWQRAFHALPEIQRIFDGVAAVMESGNGEVNWEMAHQERIYLFAGLRDDLVRHVEDVRVRAMMILTNALKEFVRSCMRCGTFLLPRRRYESAPEPDAIRTHGEKILASGTLWMRVSRSTASACALQLDGFAFASAVRFAHLRDSEELDLLFEQRLIGPAGRIREQAQSLLQALDEGATEEVTRQATCRAADAATFELHQRIAADVLTSFSGAQHRERFTGCVAELQRSVGRAATRVGSSFQATLPGEIPLQEGGRAPNPSVHDVPSRQLSQELVMAQVTRNIEIAGGQLGLALDRAEELTHEILRVVDFNFQAAVEELTGEHEDDSRSSERACAYVRLGLQRVIEKIRGLEELAIQRRAELLATLGTAVDGALEQYLARIREVSADARRRVQSEARSEDSAASSLVPADETAKLWRREVIGPEVEHLTLLLRDASFERFVASPLPESYRRLFLSDDRVDALFDVGLERAVPGFAGALSSWQRGELESVALVGLRGVGKSSVFRQVQSRLAADVPLLQLSVSNRVLDEAGLANMLARGFNLPPMDRIADLERRILQRQDRVAVYVEGGERLFLRHPEGLDGIRALMGLIHATGERVLWQVSFECAAFDFLQRVLNISEAFTTVVPASNLSREELERFILLRHDISGLPLVWGGSDRSVRDPADDVRRFFDDFHERTDGYPPLAVYLWLRALRTIPGKDALAVERVTGLPRGLLDGLDGLRAAALATILLHGGLQLDEFCRAIRLPRADGSALLGQLRHLHLVEGSNAGSRGFMVNRVAFQQIYRELRTRNLV